jgi:DNA-binding Xre family transcriptional regulator
MKVRNNLPKLMGEKRVKSLKELSRTTNLPYSTLYNFHTEKQETFNAELIKTLCKTFDCEIGDLLYLEKEEVN